MLFRSFAELNWFHSLSTDVVGYQIEVKTGSQYDSLTTVPYTNSFTDIITTSAFYKNPCEEVVTYVIKAIDLCGNTSAQNVYSPGSVHNTILLNVDIEINCDRKATLSWNKYNNLQPNLAEYRIMRSQNTGTAIQVGTISSSNAADYEFTDEEILTPGDLYTYHIMAVNSDQSFSSESCRVNVIPDPDLVNS